MSLTLVHARFQFLETVRIPIVLAGTMVFPAVGLLFFVAPNPEVGGDPMAATAAVGQLSLFAVLSTCLFTFGVGVADDRAQPWDPYVRTLPAGPWPRLGGRLLNGVAFALLGLLPVVLLAAVLTEATVTPARLTAGVGAVVLGAAPFLFGGFAIGYAMPVKAALPVAQILMFPLAFGGGLFIPPQLFPGWLDALSVWLPSRGGRDLVVWSLTGAPPSTVALLTLAGWTVLTAVLAAGAYQRDEGRRFR